MNLIIFAHLNKFKIKNFPVFKLKKKKKKEKLTQKIRKVFCKKKNIQTLINQS